MNVRSICIVLVLTICSGISYAVSAQEARDSLEAVLNDAEGLDRVPVLNQLAQLIRSPDHDQAIAYGLEALALLDSTSNDSLKAISLHALGAAYMTAAKYDSARVVSTQSRDLSEAIGDTTQLIRALSLMAESHFRQRDYPTAVEYTQLALDYSTETKDSTGISASSLMLGNLHNNQGNYDLSITYYELAADIRRQQGEEAVLATIISNTGVAYRRKGDYDKALEYYFEALGLFEQYDNLPRLASTYTNLGVLSFYLGNYDDAIQYHSRSLDLNETLNRDDGMASALSNLGVVYNQIGELDRALSFHNRSLAIERELGDQGGIAQGLNNIGLVMFNKGNYEQALDQYLQSLSLKRDIGDPELIINTLHNMAEVYGKLNDQTQAFLHAEEALSLSMETGNVTAIKESHEKLSMLYEDAGMYEEALTAFKNFKIAADSLFNKDSQAVIAELQTRYLTKEQEQTIQILQQDQALQRLLLGSLLAGVISLGVIAFLVYFGYREKKKALAELDETYNQLKSAQDRLIQQEKMASLGRITAGIAHQIKNPLNFVNNFSKINEELLSEIAEDKEQPLSHVQDVLDDIKANQQRILQHGERADQIVKSMMQHVINTNTDKRAVNINVFIQEYIKIAHFGASTQNPGFSIELVQEYDKKAGEVHLVPQEIGQVIVNLYKNAYDALEQHSTSQEQGYQPRIGVSTQKKRDSVIICISDNGPGLSEDESLKVFEPFYTTKETGKGTGLGLSLSYDIVTQGHGGQLQLESKEGAGAKFSITLPLT